MNIYDFIVKKRENGKDVEVSLKDFEGKVLLIVNTATGCGLTPQYEALEALYRKFKYSGFEILDFPCNQFMEQAKGNDEEINQFCTLKYDTTFPRFKKIDVNGENADPLFKFLKIQQPEAEGKGGFMMNMMINLTSKINGKSKGNGDIKWNFEKFLINQKGEVIKRFAPTMKPEAIEQYIEKCLSGK